MSQPTGRRAGLGAALVGLLLVLTSSIGGLGAPESVAAPPSVAGASDASLDAPLPHVGGHGVLRSAHPASAAPTVPDRTSGGHGASPAIAAALLVLALLCLAIATRRACAQRRTRPAGAWGSRAPPVLTSC